ncbi:DUF1275 domain-containing protein [Undibacterium sp. Jales W-56]|uniref:YoaK family protein n=1 Tax=Undibacterium sp. Jales W-56 TaxID=2897325 RepID=UPI0021CDFCD4|nr:YoaK family protein [Undibacterium sp. Jales W-56]MCU6432767.1 DUF1275 domain-containing protein [Undibacterium sp. Jales W-56]
MTPASKDTIQGVGLGFLAGYVDTLGFVALFGLFTAHVTGNFVLIGAGLSQMSRAAGAGSLLIKFLAFPAFISGVVVARLFITAMGRRQRPVLQLAMLLQLTFLVGFMLLGLLASPIGAVQTPLAISAGMLGAIAMGVHSANARLLMPQLAPTSLMTGNVTQIVIDAVDIARGAADAATRARCGKFIWPVLAFGIGAIMAAYAYLLMGFWALLLPILILAGLALMENRVLTDAG